MSDTNDTFTNDTYRCEECGKEWTTDGPPIKVRTCSECGGRSTPVESLNNPQESNEADSHE